MDYLLFCVIRTILQYIHTSLWLVEASLHVAIYHVERPPRDLADDHMNNHITVVDAFEEIVK